MNQFHSELYKIKEILKQSRQGMSITEIARALNKNNHSVGRYLDNLLVSGQVEMRTYGKAKVFSLSTRVPLDTLMGYAQDLLIVLDQDNRIIRVNNHVLTFFERPRSDFIGNNIQFITFPETWAEFFFEKIRFALKNGIFDDEMVIPKNGKLVFRQKIIPTVFEDGKRGMTILLEDVTEKKKADTALRTSEEQFRLMAENIQDGIIIKNTEKILYINRRAEEILGYTREELFTRAPIDLAAPEDRERLQKIISDSVSSQSIPSDITFWILRKDGTRRFISNRITSARLGADVTYYIVTTDMTEWKHAQDALENQLAFLQHMINTFPNPLFYVDTSGRYLGCNSAFSHLIGKSFKEIAGKTDAEVLPEEQAAFFSEHNAALSREPGITTYSGLFRHRDASTYRMSIQKSSLVMVDGTLAGVVGLVTHMDRN